MSGAPENRPGNPIARSYGTSRKPERVRPLTEVREARLRGLERLDLDTFPPRLLVLQRLTFGAVPHRTVGAGAAEVGDAEEALLVVERGARRRPQDRHRPVLVPREVGVRQRRVVVLEVVVLHRDGHGLAGEGVGAREVHDVRGGGGAGQGAAVGGGVAEIGELVGGAHVGWCFVQEGPALGVIRRPLGRQQRVVLAVPLLRTHVFLGVVAGKALVFP